MIIIEHLIFLLNKGSLRYLSPCTKKKSRTLKNSIVFRRIDAVFYSKCIWSDTDKNYQTIKEWIVELIPKIDKWQYVIDNIKFK